MLTDDEIERYARHISLHEIGGKGQNQLKASRVLIIGAGGLGCPLALYLAAAGIGTLTLIDDDLVSLTNLQRQIGFRSEDIGQPKAQTLAQHLLSLNPTLNITPLAERLSEDNAEALIKAHDLVLDGSDNFATRYLVNRYAVHTKTPLIFAAMSQWEGQIGVYTPKSGGPCYACRFPTAPERSLAPSCAEAGIIGPLPGIMGSMMAQEAIKLITKAGEVLEHSLLIYDALTTQTFKIKTPKRENCDICSK